MNELKPRVEAIVQYVASDEFVAERDWNKVGERIDAILTKHIATVTDEEIEAASLEYDPDDIGEQVTFRCGAKWLRDKAQKFSEDEMASRTFPVVIHIRNNETGEIRQYVDELIEGWDVGEPSIFIWEEGNYSCDCNRRLFFARVKGEDEDWDGPCSEGKFSVDVRDAKTGKGYYKDFEIPDANEAQK